VCGIAAVLNPEGASRDPGPAMAAALRHRGPDGEGTVRMGPALLVHTRLAIIDPAGGQQPLRSEDGACAVVVNGEIYNHLELRTELAARGHRFATHSDSEVVVHLYEEHGIDGFRRLNGIFAVALWDDRIGRLILARDPFGVKPLYWWSDGRRLAAASEVRALMASGLVSARLDPVALDHVLTWRFVPSPRTMFAGISKLPPAGVLVAKDGRVRVVNQRAAPGEPLADASADELADALREGIVAAAQRQTMSDVPYGTFLSGGVDSAAIVAGISRSGVRPLTFTVGFPDQRSRDESPEAAETARLLGADHHATALREIEFQGALPKAVAHLEEPCGTPSSPALLALSRFAARSVKVALSGQGADEPLGGYHRARAAAALRLLDHVPAAAAPPVRRAADALPRTERAKRAARLLAAEPGPERLLRVFEISAPELRARLTRRAGEQAADERATLAADVLADVRGRDALEQALYLDTHVMLPDSLLLYGDKMSMAAGLEMRVPFLDVELMRLVERIPARMRVRWGRRKWLYRRAMRGLVPDVVLERTKHGFTTPYDRWLRGSLGAEVARRYRADSELAAHIDPGVVAGLVDAHHRRRADHKRILYCLLEVAEWHRCFVEGSLTAPPALAGAR
jgi:asparagine synthase (glutamine-hydrolysing)